MTQRKPSSSASCAVVLLTTFSECLVRRTSRGALCHVNDVLAAGRTPLHLAVYANRADACRYLIEQGAEIDRTDNNGETALYQAVVARRMKLVKLLLDSGADPFLQDDGSLMPMALESSSDELMRLLIRACARKLSINGSKDGLAHLCPEPAPVSHALWTHYDLTKPTKPERQFGLRNFFPRARSGRYSLAEEGSTRCEEQVDEQENEQSAKTKKSSTFPRGMKPSSLHACAVETDGLIEEESVGFRRQTSSRRSLRKCVDSAFKLIRRPSEESFSLRESFRRKRGRSKPVPQTSSPTEKFEPRNQFEQSPSAAKLVPREVTTCSRPTTLTVRPAPSPGATPAKSTAF